eukprot:CAMPEP_0175705902 /NCGR_PEP_ID=MMETSP0097-20121207/37773_1 /TAXON_ID=311494 /ORGANISM="Alexandrium monilatum, Strain CCMP3105" /LENGTH=49 /DNA_ID= /DNA_START= /DNA_END= /DNA_ORIENTATION=
MSRVVLSMLLLATAAASVEDELGVSASLTTDDECASSGSGTGCALNAVQ